MRAWLVGALVVVGCSYVPRGGPGPELVVVRHAGPEPGRWQDARLRQLEEVSASDWCGDAARYLDRGSFGDKVARVRSLEGAAPVRLARQDWIEHVDWSHDCTGLAYVTGDERVRAFDLAPRRRALPTLAGDGYDHDEGHDTFHVWVTPHARAVLAPRRHDGRGRPLPPLRDRAGLEPSQHSLGVSFDGRYFTDRSDVWDADTGQWRCNLDDGAQRPGLVVSEPHLYLRDDGLWSMDDCREHVRLPEAARGGELSPDGARIAYFTARDQALEVMAVATGRVVMRREVALGFAVETALGWSNDGRVLVAATDNGAVEVIDAATGAGLASWHTDAILVGMRVLASARRIVVADHGSSRVWELP